MYLKGGFVITVLYIAILVPESNATQSNEINLDKLMLHRSRRQQLLYPNSTLLQLNIGVGSPTPVKTINFNWIIQANFQLPWNTSQIPVDIFGANSGYIGTSKKKRDTDGKYENDARLYHFYKYVEGMLDSFGYNGTTCVLRTLCQLGSEPLHAISNEDLLHEIATFILNPLNDITEEKTNESMPYIIAYEAGRSYADCLLTYNSCSMSLIDLFTNLHETEF